MKGTCNMSRPYCKMENRSRSEGFGDEDERYTRPGSRPRDVRVEYRRNNSDQLPRSVMIGESGHRASDPGTRRMQERPVRVNVINRNTNQRQPEPRIFERSAPKSNHPEKSAARSSLNEKSLRDALLLKNLGRPDRVVDSSPVRTNKDGVKLRQGSGPLSRNTDSRRSWHGGTQLSTYVVPDIDLTSRDSPQKELNLSPKIERSKCPTSAGGHPRERGTDFRFTRSGRVKPGPGFVAFDPFENFETGRDTFGKVFKRHSDIMEDMIDFGDFQRRGLFESDWGLFADDPFRAGKKNPIKVEVKTHTEHRDAKGGERKRKPSQTSQSSFDKDDGLKTVIRVVKDSKKTPQQQKRSISPPPPPPPSPQQQSNVPNRNLFNRFKFDFGSFGTIGEAEDTKHKIFFRDFDDLVKRMKNIQGISEKPQNQAGKANFSPDARLAEEHRSKNKMRTSFLREEEDEFHKLFEELLCHRNNANQQAEEGASPKEEVAMTYLGKSASPKDDVKSKRASYALAESTLFEEEDDPGENPWVRKRSESLPGQPLGAQLCDNSESTAKRSSGIFDKEEKLFADLLDDLDNISGNSNSVRRRKRARDLFSDWLFRNSGAQESPAGEEAGELSTEVTEAGEFAQAQRRKNSHRKRRPLSASDYFSEDDADSGYHTGEGSLHKNKAPPGERTLTREDLNRRIEAFNDNNHGLYMSMEGETFQGFIRVHMNLIRPINMSISTRPPSIYEVLTNEEPEEPENTRIASFYLPKDTTKVIHITSDTTAQEVIRALLQKFKITDNPRKFALYEKVLHGDGKKGTMRRLGDDEKPLPLCLSWTSEGLDHRKFVLQENDTGEILWEAFSIPELENFLKILDREEEEYISQLKEKFKLQRVQMEFRLNEIEQERKKAAENSSSEREPVFV